MRTLIRTGGPPSSTSSGRVISIAMILSWSSRWSTRPFTTTMASSARRWPTASWSSGTPSPRAPPARSSSTNVAMRSPRFVYFRFSAVTMPPDRAHLALPDVAQLRQRAVDVTPQRALARRASGARSRRARASPSRTPGAATSGTRRRARACGWPAPDVERHVPASSATAENRSNWPSASLRRRSMTASTIVSNTSQQALARVAERVEPARLHQRLDRALVEHRRVDAVAEVVEVGERTCPPRGRRRSARRRPRRRCAPPTCRSGSRAGRPRPGRGVGIAVAAPRSRSPTRSRRGRARRSRAGGTR